MVRIKWPAAGEALAGSGVTVGGAAVAVAVGAIELGYSHTGIWSNAWVVAGIILVGVGLLIATFFFVAGFFEFGGKSTESEAGTAVPDESTVEAREARVRLDDRSHRERAPRLDARVTTHLAVQGRNGLPLYRLELRLLGPSDLDQVDVYIEDGRWLAFTGNQTGVSEPFGTGFAIGDFSSEATLISYHAYRSSALRVGGRPATWRVQLANMPLTTGDQAPIIRAECCSGDEKWNVAVPIKDADILLDHPVIRVGLGPSWPRPRPILWPSTRPQPHSSE